MKLLLWLKGGKLMIEFKNISKGYKTKKILKNINLNIEKGKLVTIIGESGCGKTTLLKMINRLIKPSSGAIYIDGKNIKSIDEVMLRRNIGYVYNKQDYFLI